ncbi:hypothetical protein MP638_003707 [Amoeboaphelidium occidentale]|nr:hypothetical protein MP638_003707 [Amoeboaphelidium occidentale]
MSHSNAEGVGGGGNVKWTVKKMFQSMRLDVKLLELSSSSSEEEEEEEEEEEDDEEEESEIHFSLKKNQTDKVVKYSKALLQVIDDDNYNDKKEDFQISPRDKVELLFLAQQYSECLSMIDILPKDDWSLLLLTLLIYMKWGKYQLARKQCFKVIRNLLLLLKEEDSLLLFLVECYFNGSSVKKMYEKMMSVVVVVVVVVKKEIEFIRDGLMLSYLYKNYCKKSLKEEEDKELFMKLLKMEDYYDYSSWSSPSLKDLNQLELSLFHFSLNIRLSVCKEFGLLKQYSYWLKMAQGIVDEDSFEEVELFHLGLLQFNRELCSSSSSSSSSSSDDDVNVNVNVNSELMELMFKQRFYLDYGKDYFKGLEELLLLLDQTEKKYEDVLLVYVFSKCLLHVLKKENGSEMKENISNSESDSVAVLNDALVKEFMQLNLTAGLMEKTDSILSVYDFVCKSITMALYYMIEEKYQKTKFHLLNALKQTVSNSCSCSDADVMVYMNNLKSICLCLLGIVYHLTNNQESGKMFETALAYSDSEKGDLAVSLCCIDYLLKAKKKNKDDDDDEELVKKREKILGKIRVMRK